jgi:hypothetical protein
MILLVGLTELKAQVSWVDSATVSAHMPPVESRVLISHPTSTSVNLGERNEVGSIPSRVYPPRLNSVIRSNAVVVYDNPSEMI